MPPSGRLAALQTMAKRQQTTGSFRSDAAFDQMTERVQLGRPAPTILRVAAEIHADLIVMGAQGGGPLGLALFGSATQAVLRGARCPVLTTRARRQHAEIEATIDSRRVQVTALCSYRARVSGKRLLRVFS
jgi:nucleotide-binding universal stress UspA family protein